MTQQSQELREALADHYSSCCHTFVNWKWFSSVIITLFVGIVLIAATATARVQTINDKSDYNEQRIEKLEEKLDKKLDYIIQRLEHK